MANELAKIHIARKELGLTEEEYRDIMRVNFKGKESSKDLSLFERNQMLTIMQGKGWKPKSTQTVKHGRTSTRRKDDNFIEIKLGPYAKMQRKVLAQWAALGYDVAKLHARCKRQWGVDRFEWLQDYEALHILITDLEKRLEAAGIK